MKRGWTTTRREQKHELLLTFMAIANARKPARKTAQPKPRLLRTLLSLFM